MQKFNGDLMTALSDAVRADPTPAPARKPRRIPAALPECLKYAGGLGHTWFVTYVTVEGAERLYSECPDAASAVRTFDQFDASVKRIYTREGGKLRRVTRSAALIAS